MSKCSAVLFQEGFPKQAGDVHECTSGNNSKSLVEGKVFVDLLECASLKGTVSLASERAA